ncbi:MAG: hypothetical protein KDA93_00365 [Planctomycetaceae bacterium]|nr:hypothetical protein [Planctomycetaceae bacterium]
MTTPRFQTCPKCDRRSWRLEKCLQCGYEGPPGTTRPGVIRNQRRRSTCSTSARPLFGDSSFVGLDLFDAVWAFDCADFASDIMSDWED